MSRAPRNASRGSSTDNPLVRSLPICGHFARIFFFFSRFLETDKNLLPQPLGRNDLIPKPGREGRRERKLIPTFQPSTLRTYPYRNTASVPNLISLRSFPLLHFLFLLVLLLDDESSHYEENLPVRVVSNSKFRIWKWVGRGDGGGEAMSRAGERSR